MPDTVLAAQMYTLRKFTRNPADIARTLAKVRAVGYQAIQISAFGPCDPAELARMLAGEGLAVCSTHTPWPRFLEEMDQVIEEHRLWGCQHPAIGGMPKEYRSAEGVVAFAKAAEQVGRKLAQAGMDFSYHNHNFEFQKAGGTTWLERLYESCDGNYVKAEIDTYWVQAGGGDPAAWIRKYAGRMPILHLKDMVMGPDGVRMAEIGEGNLNWPAILAAAKDAGVQWYCVEQDDCYERDPFESLKISLENLHEMAMR
ncbi:MAG: xylose isomerase [Phycisphaerae bacterium SM23_33]|jgi:sugar phosphate isomerase/epimerase|nr:MAG: xylose isomerase [Phycisphaerae bacterium SM23_33]